jgi:peptide/nickel transport system substrate-binding protein
MCQGIVDQWQKNLGITVKIVLCTLDERNKAIATGKASIWRSGWVADYPDPENFLTLFYGRSEKGSTKMGYFNQRYNTALDNALSETDPTKRNSLLKFCDQLIIAEAPVSPILTNDFLVMVNSRIRNFETNPMELIDFSTIFIREPQN